MAALQFLIPSAAGPYFVSETVTRQALVGPNFWTSVVAVPPPPIIDDTDTHDGKHLKKRFDDEIAARERRRNDTIAAYELLVEGRPALAAEIVEPFVARGVAITAIPSRTQVDWSAVLAQVETVDRLWAAFLELDDEDVLVLL